MVDDVVPELPRREAFADVYRAADGQGRADGNDAADRVIERQAIVDAVALLGVHHRREGDHRSEHAVMVDVRRLGEAGRAAGVDVETAVVEGELRPLGWRDRIVGEVHHRLVDPRKPIGGSAVRPHMRAGGEEGGGGGEGVAELGRHDDVLRLGEIDAMGKHGAGQMRVEEGHHAAGTRDAEPDRREFRPVGHEQADHVALVHPIRRRPAGVAVGAGVVPGEGEGLAIGEERRPVAIAPRQLLGDVGKGALFVPRHGGDAGQRAQDAAHIGEVVADIPEKAHSQDPARLPVASLDEPDAMSEIDWKCDARVDASGLACPLPVLKARKALLGLAPGERLALAATDNMAAIDVPHFCNQAGHRLVASETTGDVLRFLIERRAE